MNKTQTHDQIPNERRRNLIRLGLAAPISLLGVSNSFSQQIYPNRPIRAIVPVPAGGTLDLIGRQLSQRIQPALGQSLVIENRSGAAGQVGVAAVARSIADGYTLLLANDPPFSILPALGNPMQFNPDNDFAPISLLAQASLVLVTSNDLPVNNLRELVAYIKTNPGKIPYASAGIGSQHHIGMERFMVMTGLDMVHIPYAGIAPAFNSLLAGETKMLFAALTLPLPHIATGKVKAFGVSGPQRHTLLPNVPTFIEQGFADFTVGAWFGLFAPAATPNDIVKRLQSVVWEAISSRDFIENVLFKMGFELNTSISPEKFPTFLKEDRKKWSEVVAQINPLKFKN